MRYIGKMSYGGGFYGILICAIAPKYILRRFDMKNIMTRAHAFIRDDEGAALAEYAILIAFIAIVCIVAVTFFGSKISGKFASLGQSIS